LPLASLRMWILFTCSFLFFIEVSAQKNNEEPISKHAKITAFDTNYIYKYTTALTIGPCLSYRNFNILLFPKTPVDSGFAENLKWRSPSDRFWGLDFNYDKFGFTMSFASVEPKAEQDKKGKSSSSSFAFSYGGNRAFLEFSTMTFKGFYEMNTALMDTTLNTYYQSPGLTSFLLNMKAWYFTNHHKFAFKSCYGGLYRQLKSQASWAFSSNLHFNSIITDSSMVPDSDKQFYDNALQVKTINSIGLSLMGGGAWNIVFKKVYFINLAWVLGPDFQALSMSVNDTLRGRSYVSYTQDFRFATGFNFNKWYLTFAIKHETNVFRNEYLETRIRLNSFSLNLGWRFPVKTPTLYKKFQRTWLYALF
jgi:hypothetical protein